MKDLVETVLELSERRRRAEKQHHDSEQRRNALTGSLRTRKDLGKKLTTRITHNVADLCQQRLLHARAIDEQCADDYHRQQHRRE